ncbi:metalloregulator ArsR/SmtB family transcription factor [Bacillus sp. JCM 19041]|uniref:ArsR/SmtB family transcription factor n=1 Tax=Bacillus sp. JCM 19041 TaxID=1460637 RepID=UPI0006D1ADBA
MEAVKLSSAKMAECMKLISDPTRLLMMKLVSKKEYCVCQFVDMFGISQPAVSQHLRKLKQAGLMKEERRGQWRFYSMDHDSLNTSMIQLILAQIDDETQTSLNF